MTAPTHPTITCSLCSLVGAIGLAVFFGGCSGPQSTPARNDPDFRGGRVESKATRDPPPSAKTLYSMADILATQGKDTECEFVLRRCLQEHPRFTPAYNSLAELQMRQGRVREAVEVLSRALQIRPRDPVLLNNLGMCLLIREEYEIALVHFTKAAGVVPENKRYRANMATALGLLGRQEESLALLQQVLPPGKAEHNAELLRQAYDKKTQPIGSAPSI